MSDKGERIVFRDGEGNLCWFSSDQIERVWKEFAVPGSNKMPEFDCLALLPGNKWVLYDEPVPWEKLTKARFVRDNEALEWLLQRGHELPASLMGAWNERCVVKASDKRNESLLQVLDEDDGSRPVVIDVSGAQSWGPCKADSGDYDPLDFVPQWFYSDTLYRLSTGRFVRVRHRAHREADIPFEPEVKRLSDEEAARWLLFEGFEPPADIAKFADKHRFTDEPNHCGNDADEPSRKRNNNLKHVIDQDDGDRLVMLDTSGAQKWGPFSSFDADEKATFHYDVFRLTSGKFVRIGYTSDDASDIPFDVFAKRISDEEAARLLILGTFEPPADIAPLADKHRFAGEVQARSNEPSMPDGDRPPLEACEEMKPQYRDPDNYWRNVWLYEQRKASKTNAAILTELETRASEFEPLESENALRSAIDSIARHHRWPILKGKSGRPSARSRAGDGEVKS